MLRVLSALEILAWSKEPTSERVAMQLSKIEASKDITIEFFVEVEILAGNNVEESERLTAEIFAAKRLENERKNGKEFNDAPIVAEMKNFELLSNPIKSGQKNYLLSWVLG